MWKTAQSARSSASKAAKRPRRPVFDLGRGELQLQARVLDFPRRPVCPGRRRAGFTASISARCFRASISFAGWNTYIQIGLLQLATPEEAEALATHAGLDFDFFAAAGLGTGCHRPVSAARRVSSPLASRSRRVCLARTRVVPPSHPSSTSARVTLPVQDERPAAWLTLPRTHP
jgi:hypothetical protein